MKVIAFNGSPREEGNTFALLSHLLDQLNGHGLETELVQLGKKPLSGCIACDKCIENKDKKCALQNDPLNEYLEKMYQADGIILGSPTYFSNLTSNMKSLIDRCGRVSRVNGFALKRKLGASVVAMRRAGSNHVFSSLNYFFLISQMIVVGSDYWNAGVGMKEKDVLQDKEGLQTMEILADNFSWLLKKIHS